MASSAPLTTDHAARRSPIGSPTTPEWATIGLGVVIAAASPLALGIAGAAATCAALALYNRSHRAAAVALVLAAVPLAVATPSAGRTS